jgi:hypothetical protein
MMTPDFKVMTVAELRQYASLSTSTFLQPNHDFRNLLRFFKLNKAQEIRPLYGY